MSAVELVGVSKQYGTTVAVDTVSLEVREGELLALLGPSGCGKTTLLRMIAGFVKPTGGSPSPASSSPAVACCARSTCCP